MAVRKNSVTIRMGAAHWDVTVHGPDKDIVFDLRKMDRKSRGKFYGTFMSSVRKALRQGAGA